MLKKPVDMRSVRRNSKMEPKKATKSNKNVERPPPAGPKSKSPIPTAMRMELENALIGLCDLWFDEIKPALVENKVKIHGMAHGPHGRCSPQLVDRVVADTLRPDCAELDMAAAMANPYCDLCKLILNTASKINTVVANAAQHAAASPTPPARAAALPLQLSATPSSASEFSPLKGLAAGDKHTKPYYL